MIVRKFVFTLFLALLYASTALAWPGKVVRVVDGDTIVVLNGQNKQIKIRLYGIDTPEKKQAFGQKAKQFTARLVWKKQVDVKSVTTDRYGRTIALVFFDNHKSLNQELIANGFAWVYRQYCTSRRLCKRWLQAESEARKLRRGLWSDPNPTPPWEWRRNKPHTYNNQSYIFTETTNYNFTCGQKRYCSQMSSCEEARFYLDVCGLKRLDGNGNGVPCEKICK
jgi:endonuclease YncB( thermonuclease family)